MVNLIQLLTDQRAYKGITHSQWGASWNGDEGGLVMTKTEDSPLRSPKRAPDLASRWRIGGGGGSVSWNMMQLQPLFFLQKIGFYRVRDSVSGATRWAQLTWARQEGTRPSGLCSPRDPPPVVLGSSIFLLFHKKSPKSFVPFRELLFLHKNNTMVVLLKTASVRVSFIQIMQIRFQNNSKSVRKSRYDGNVSTPPSLNLCLSSSNSVDKLKVKMKNFYELFCSCIRIYA
jgi:hypothetical protein